MPFLNPWFRCACGKAHIFPRFSLRVVCKCGRVHDWSRLSDEAGS